MAGLLKHVTHGMRGVIATLGSDELPELDAAAYAAYMSSFALTDDETTEQVLADFDEVRPRYLAALAAAPATPTSCARRSTASRCPPWS